MRAYFLTLQYWLAGSEENVANMVRMLVDRYADGARARHCAASLQAAPPVEYPEVGLYHPRASGSASCERLEQLPPHGNAAARSACW